MKRKHCLSLCLIIFACLETEAIAPAAEREPTIAAFVLPSRAPLASERVHRIALRTVQRMGGSLAEDVRPLALGERLARARLFAQSGALDEAATIFDSVIEEGARSPHRISTAESAEFIAAHVRRATIALARGEMPRARMLLSRMLRYDAAVDLQPLEKNPQNQAVLADVRKQLGSHPALDASDLGDACQAATVLLVARRQTPSGFLIDRFDHCEQVAEVVVNDSESEEQVVTTLAKLPVRISITALTPAPPPRPLLRNRSDRTGRAKIIAGALVAAAGVALAGAGVYYAVRAKERADDIQGGCTASAPCLGIDIEHREDAYRGAAITGGVLVPMGALALVTGCVLAAVGIKQDRAHTTVAVTPGGAVIGWVFE